MDHILLNNLLKGVNQVIFPEKNCMYNFGSMNHELGKSYASFLCDNGLLLFFFCSSLAISLWLVGDGIGSFIIKDNSSLQGSCGMDMVRTKAAKYSIALHYLILEEIYENEEQRYHV